MTLFRRVRRAVREQAQRAQAAVISPLAHLFAEQLAVVRDPAKFKTLLCGGRGGKTNTILHKIVDLMQTTPNARCLFTAQTRTTAKNILWEPLRDLNIKHGWGLILNESELRARHPNGSWLLLAGMDSRPELEKARGIPWNIVCIDECGSHRPSYLQYYVEEVIEARLMDRDGELWLAGTPTSQAFGYFYEATQGKLQGFSRHHWTAASNPHINFEAYTTQMLKRRGWTRDHPSFRREFLAEWIVDTTRLVYRFTRERNVVDALPPLARGDEWVYVLGLDFGVGDKTAAAVLAYPRHFGRDVYVVHTWAKSGLAPSEACEHIKTIVDEWHPERIVGDVGGMGKAYQAEWNKRFPEVAMAAANKQDKRAGLEFVSDALFTAVSLGTHADRRGLMSLASNDNSGASLHGEWATLQWDEKREDIAEGQDDDVSDAVMYAYKDTPAYANERELPAEPESVVGTTWERKRATPQVPDRYKELAAGWGRRR